MRDELGEDCSNWLATNIVDSIKFGLAVVFLAVCTGIGLGTLIGLTIVLTAKIAWLFGVEIQ